MWVFRLWGALVFAVLGEGVTRSCHPERGRAPIRFLQDGKPESKDLGFVLPPPGAPPFAVLGEGGFTSALLCRRRTALLFGWLHITERTVQQQVIDNFHRAADHQ